MYIASCKKPDIKIILENIVRHAANTSINSFCKQQNKNMLTKILKRKTADYNKRKT